MIYGAMLAGGVGTRVKSSIIPKQFIEIGGKPIIIYTLENILKVDRFDYVYIAVHKDYEEYMNEQVKKNISCPEKVKIILGGKERLDSINNVTSAIEKNHGITDEDVIVIHDAVRPFVTEKILNDSIDAAAEYGACVCGLPCADTILHSKGGEYVEDIPNRAELYSGQAPDSFRLKHFVDMQNNLTDEQKKVITGTSQICTMNNQPIHIIEGDAINFKITTDSDLLMVKTLLGNKQ